MTDENPYASPTPDAPAKKQVRDAPFLQGVSIAAATLFWMGLLMTAIHSANTYVPGAYAQASFICAVFVAAGIFAKQRGYRIATIVVLLYLLATSLGDIVQWL